jgi:hypothetical protein
MSAAGFGAVKDPGVKKVIVKSENHKLKILGVKKSTQPRVYRLFTGAS